MGKKAKKVGKGKEKTERKTAKAEEKRARREAKKVSEEDDIDAILRSIQKEEAKKKEVHVEDNVPAPSPRSNCSSNPHSAKETPLWRKSFPVGEDQDNHETPKFYQLNINPLKDTELIFYGGEFYNGKKTFVYGDLYRYDVEKNQWKLVSSPNSPPPRSAHQAVAWKDHIYIFGGEFTSPNQERFHHYKDFWTLDLKTNQWEQLLLKGCPSARSGHRMILYKHKIIVFGGFYDTLREVRYYNDLHVFDLDQYKWQEIKPRPGSMWPSARSGFQLFVFQDEIFLYGGYSKEVANDKSGSEKGIVHSDLWSLDPRTWEWNKAKKNGMPPGPRAGFSTCVHKKRAVFFGGVVDMETEGDVIMSLFMNELYGFQLDTRRWYPLELRKDKPTKTKLKGRKENESMKDINNSRGSQDDTELSEVIEGDETMDIDEEEIDSEYDSKEVANHMKKNLSLNGNTSRKIPDVKVQGLVGDSPMQAGSLSEAVKPCGRINSCMVVAKDMLYLYGGMMEVNDREISLDDLYSLNLSKLDEWKCLIPASESEWLEVSEEEEDDDGDDDNDDDSDEESSNASSEGTDDDDDNDTECPENGETTLDMGAAVSIIKGETKNLRRKDKRVRIEQIRVSLGLADSQRTPVPGESLKDFYRRTCMYWQMAAHEHTQHTGKELRKDGFDLAEARFKELKPILDELAILEAEQKAEEETAAETSSRKRVTKKSNQKKSGK